MFHLQQPLREHARHRFARQRHVLGKSLFLTPTGLRAQTERASQRPGGLIFPDHCSIHLAAIEDAEYKETKIGFWEDVYGFDYTPVRPQASFDVL